LLLARGAIVAGRVAAGTASRSGPLLCLLVHCLTQFHRDLRQRIGFGGDRRGIVALEGFLEVCQRVLDAAPLGLADLRAMLGERLLGGMDQRLGMILRLNFGLALLVFLSMRFGIL